VCRPRRLYLKGTIGGTRLDHAFMKDSGLFIKPPVFTGNGG